MPDKNTAALDFLASRRSRPAKVLTPPVPTHEELTELLTLAARSPDHGALAPWRFVVMEKAALERVAAGIAEYGAAAGVEEGRIERAAAQFGGAHLVVAVVFSPVASDKAPEFEQVLSAGAVCLALLNAALASGWGANWITGWAAHDAGFVQAHLGLAEGEKIAGLIHIGTASATPPDRPRPDIAAKTTWL